jgi:flagellar hook-associated protein 3 FlgL
MPVGRISDQLRYLSLVPRYSSLLSQQIDVQTQIASGKQYQRADENPLAVALSQRFNAESARLDQNVRNINEAQAFTTAADTSVGTALQNMQRALELAVSGGDGSKSVAARTVLSQEVNQILKGTIDLGTTAWHGRYVFSGTETTTPSFTADLDGSGAIVGVTYNGDGGDLAMEYSPQNNISYNQLGSDESGGTFGVFRNSATGVDIFQTLIDLRDHLVSNPAALSADITRINSDITHLTSTEGQIGGIQNRLNFSSISHEDQKMSLEEASAKLVDTDIAEAISRLTSLRTSYEASLNIGARVNETSLLNFLR